MFKKLLTFLCTALFAVSINAETWQKGAQVAASALQAGDVILLSRYDTSRPDAQWLGGYHTLKSSGNQVATSGAAANYSLGLFPSIKNRSAFRLVAGPIMNSQTSYYLQEVTTGKFITAPVTTTEKPLIDLTTEKENAISFVPTVHDGNSRLIYYDSENTPYYFGPFNGSDYLRFGTSSSANDWIFYYAEETANSFMQSEQVDISGLYDGLEVLMQNATNRTDGYGRPASVGEQYLDNVLITSNAKSYVNSISKVGQSLRFSSGYSESNIWVLEALEPAVAAVDANHSASYYIKNKESGEYLSKDPNSAQGVVTTDKQEDAFVCVFGPRNESTTTSIASNANEKTMTIKGNGSLIGSAHNYGYVSYAWADAGIWNIYKTSPITDESKKQEALNALHELISECDAFVSNATVGTDPGMVVSTTNLESALTAAQAITSSSSMAEIQTATQNLAAAQNALQFVPITEGYYYIVSAGNGPGYSGGPYNYEDKSAMYNDKTDGLVKWAAYDRTDAKQVFFLSQKANNAWYVYNVADDSYIDNGGTANSGTVYTSKAAINAQEFHTLADGAGRFAIKSPSHCYGLAQGHNGSAEAAGNLCIWGTVNDCKNFRVNVWYLHKATNAEIQAAQTLAIENIEAITYYGNNPGLYTETSALNYNSTLSAAKAAAAAGTADATTYENLMLAKGQLVVNPITEGYYFIVSDNALIAANNKSEKALYTNATTGTLYWGEFDELNIQFLFRFISAGNDTWFIQNVDNEKYIGAARYDAEKDTYFCQQFDNTDNPTYPATFYFDGEGSFRIMTNNWTLCPQGNATGKSNGPSYVWSYNATGVHGEASFTLRKVGLTEITIGSTGYSTYVTDKALVIPDGVTAYGVTGLSSNDLTMTTLTGNVLAANEPVILQGEANKKYYFIETTEAGSGITGNQLQGTGVGAGLDVAANTAYVLYNNGGTAVFRIAAAMTLPAHKAYLPASFVGGSSSGMFNLSDDLTGVAAIVNGQSSMVNEIFDLQGRKVASPKKGQIYIVNGKTVLY